jgi:2-iminobutanoate/2-iminopropanoate deaminase
MSADVKRRDIVNAPAPKGAYSQAVQAGDFLFVSGQGPIEPASNEFAFGDIRQETKLALENVKRVLEGCGASLSDIVKCSVFLAEASDFAAMNEVYAAFFKGSAPARTTVQATLVEPGMKVEIDCIAYHPALPTLKNGSVIG